MAATIFPKLTESDGHSGLPATIASPVPKVYALKNNSRIIIQIRSAFPDQMKCNQLHIHSQHNTRIYVPLVGSIQPMLISSFDASSQRGLTRTTGLPNR